MRGNNCKEENVQKFKFVEEIYNLFKGFKAEKYRPDKPMTEDEILRLVEPIITHFDYLTSGNSSYLLQWMANIIQTPHIKSEIAPLIRDEGGLILEGGGTGKNIGFELIVNFAILVASI